MNTQLVWREPITIDDPMPADPEEGHCVYRTTDCEFFAYDGEKWMGFIEFFTEQKPGPHQLGEVTRL